MSSTLKRKLIEDDVSEPAAKRQAYEQLPQDELVDRVIELEAQAQLKKWRSAGQQSGNVAAASVPMSEARILESNEKITTMMAREIKKQMKWQPSCKTGKTKWSYTTVIPHVEVMQRIIKPDEKAKSKAWKQRKISKEDLEDGIGYISASVRYGSLRVTSEMINVKWDEETKMLSLSGTYGV